MRINHETLYLVTDALRAVSEGNYPKWWHFSCGLCTNIEEILCEEGDDSYDAIMDLSQDGMAAWPGGTGDRNFPVPAQIDAYHGQQARFYAEGVHGDAYLGDSRLYTGTYGKARRELAAWLADWMEQQV